METPCFVAVRFEICLPLCAGIFVNAQKMTDTARFGGPAAVAASANARLAVPDPRRVPAVSRLPTIAAR